MYYRAPEKAKYQAENTRQTETLKSKNNVDIFLLELTVSFFCLSYGALACDLTCFPTPRVRIQVGSRYCLVYSMCFSLPCGLVFTLEHLDIRGKCKMWWPRYWCEFVLVSKAKESEVSTVGRNSSTCTSEPVTSLQSFLVSFIAYHQKKKDKTCCDQL